LKLDSKLSSDIITTAPEQYSGTGLPYITLSIVYCTNYTYCPDQWKPPEQYSGIVVLRATVVLDYKTFWTDLRNWKKKHNCTWQTQQKKFFL